MLPRKYRITKDKEYKNIFQNGIAVFSETITVKGIKNDLGFDRIGFIASLKVSKKAHIRTKIKRWLREAARQILREGIENGFDIAVIAKKGAYEAGFSKLDSELKNVFIKLEKIYERKKYSEKSRASAMRDKTDKTISNNNISGS